MKVEDHISVSAVLSVLSGMASVMDESERPLTNHGRRAQIVPRKPENINSVVSKREMSIDSLSATSEGKRLIEIFFAEFTGTGILILLGCMSQLVWSESDTMHPWQGSVVFAVVVTTVITMFGHISSAHLNPAITLNFLMLGHLTYLEAVVYVIAEIAGAIAGYGILKLVTPCDIFELSMQYSGGKVCVNYPHESMSDVQALGAEFIATSVLVLVNCSCNDPRNSGKGETNALKFGATILALCIAESPYTGASMNPARSLGPVVWTKFWDKHWIYWIAPLSASFCSTIYYLQMFGLKKNPDDKNVFRNPELGNVTVH